MRHFILPLLDNFKARSSDASFNFTFPQNQVEVLNRVFMPTAEKFDEVQEIVGIAPETSEKGDDIPF